MQRLLQESKADTATATRFDNQSVREILARATEIEQRHKDDALTAKQVETLGRELGVSPEAVRQALREKVSVAESHTNHNRQYVTGAITRKDVKTAVALGAIYAVVAFLDLMSIYLLLDRIPQDAFLYWGVAIVDMCILGPLPAILLFGYAWRRKDWRQGLLTSAFLAPLYISAILLAVFMNSMITRAYTPLNMGVFVPLVFWSVFMGISGGWAGKWWHDSKIAEER